MLPFVFAAGAVAAGAPLHLNVTAHALANGLTLLVYEDHAAPVVSVQVWYRTGAYDDPAGLTGISHLLEHMAFRGTRHTPAREYDRIIEGLGGENNAFTATHYTCYWANLARESYPVELRLEADRMRNLVLDSALFEIERKVVMEERRLGENSPYGVLNEEFDAVAFKLHPYRNPIIGWMEDLERIRHADLVTYYRNHYAPANTIIMLAGDITPAEARHEVARCFGRLRSRPTAAVRYVEPPQRGERRITVRRDVGTQALYLGFHIPAVGDTDSYVLDVIGELLSGGRSTRLYQRLVHERQLALTVSAGAWTPSDPGMFYVFAIPRPGRTLAELEAAVLAELDLLKAEPVTARELEKVKNQVVAGFTFGQGSVDRMGMRIASTEITAGSYHYLETYADRISAVTADQVRQVAGTYFVPDNRTVAWLEPEDRP